MIEKGLYMSMITYKTRGNQSPQSLPHVYFCAHHEDYDKYFEMIATQLLEKQNCAVWHLEDPTISWNEELKDNLSRMQLFVIPVTSKFLFQENRARLQELAYALEHHIPVLPLQQEPGLEGFFNQKCGDLQMLYEDNSDATALSYEDKLEKFLASVLVGDELAEKIRKAFDAYVFLSYRKKDRRYAHELMKLIHQNDFCRDIAIWYDEFLVPGENFNQAIRDAMNKSQLFVLTVTPNLVNEANYIQNVEYPEAVLSGKTIVPAQMEDTDTTQLSEQYQAIPPCVDPRDDETFAKTLQRAIGEIGLRENDNDPSHNFFIGLAYLSGVDVEVNYERAKEMIEGAANAGFLPAVNKMAEMYQHGKGVERNAEHVVFWRERAVDLCRVKYETNPNMREAEDFGFALFQLCECLMGLGQLERARKNAEELYNLCQTMSESNHLQWHRATLYTCFDMATIFNSKEDSESAIMWAKRGMHVCDVLCELDDKTQHRVYLDLVYRLMFRVYYQYPDHTPVALEWGQKWIALWEQEAANDPSSYCRSQLASACVNVGWAETSCRRLKQAMQHFQTALSIEKILAKEPAAGERRDKMAFVYLGLTYVSEGQNDIEAVMEYSLRAVELLEEYTEENDTRYSKTLLVSAYLFLSDSYEKLGHYRDACVYLEKQLMLTEHLAAMTDIPANRQRMIINLYRLGDMYLQLKESEKAKYWFERALQEIESWLQQGETAAKLRLLGVCYYKMQQLYEALGQSDKAKEWGKKSTDAHLRASSFNGVS